MHAHSLMDTYSAAEPTVATTDTSCTSQTNPLRAGQLTWIGWDPRIMHDNQAGGDVAGALLTPTGYPGGPAEQAMPALAEAFGLDPCPGAHTPLPDTLHITLSTGCEQPWITLHIGSDLTLRWPVPTAWHHLAATRGWVRLVINYQAARAAAPDSSHDLLSGHRVTADLLVRV